MSNDIGFVGCANLLEKSIIFGFLLNINNIEFMFDSLLRKMLAGALEKDAQHTRFRCLRPGSS